MLLVSPVVTCSVSSACFSKQNIELYHKPGMCHHDVTDFQGSKLLVTTMFVGGHKRAEHQAVS